MTAQASQPLPGIDHVILLMFENRSFDNMLGAFFPSQKDRGGVPPGFANPWPGSPNVTAFQASAGSPAQIIPYPDPHEHFTNMSSQINRFGPMQGFVADYSTVPAASAPNIMQFYRQDNVPVTHALAMKYGVCDRWFASGPVQTWPNRLFSLCGTPGSDAKTNRAYLNNDQYPSYPVLGGQLALPSVFEQLDGAGHSWGVYYDDEAPIAWLIAYVLNKIGNSHYFSQFYSDLKNNNLPTFSLLEPRYQYLSLHGYVAPNSNHPGSSDAILPTGVPISVSCGERLLAQVYNALAASPYYDNTLLVVTYDEHGGLFDHVYPPPATSPFSPPVTGYGYTQYGVRVPTLLINKYLAFRGTNPFPANGALAFDHTSLLATLRDQFSLGGSLTPRVAGAPTLAGAIDPSLPPIPPGTITPPACTWTPPATAGHAAPMLHTALARARALTDLRKEE